MWHWPVGSIAVPYGWCWDAVIDFLPRTTQQWLTMLFNRLDDPPKYSFPWEIWTLIPQESVPQTASRSVQPFLQRSRTWLTDGHTQADRSRYSVHSNRPHLATAAMLPNDDDDDDDALPEFAAVMIGVEKAGAAATCGVGVCVAGNSAEPPPGHCVTMDAMSACCWTSCTSSSIHHHHRHRNIWDQVIYEQL